MFGSVPCRCSISDRTHTSPRGSRAYRHGISKFPISPGRESIDLGIISSFGEALREIWACVIGLQPSILADVS